MAATVPRPRHYDIRQNLIFLRLLPTGGASRGERVSNRHTVDFVCWQTDRTATTCFNALLANLLILHGVPEHRWSFTTWVHVPPAQNGGPKVANGYCFWAARDFLRHDVRSVVSSAFTDQLCMIADNLGYMVGCVDRVVVLEKILHISTAWWSLRCRGRQQEIHFIFHLPICSAPKMWVIPFCSARSSHWIVSPEVDYSTALLCLRLFG